MKLITFITSGIKAAGYIDGDAAVVCVEGEKADRAVLDVIAAGKDGLDVWRAKGGQQIPLSDVQLLAPIPVPIRDIFCLGENYYAQAAVFDSRGFGASAQVQGPAHPGVCS